MSFAKFVQRKHEEILNRGQSFDEAKITGAYPHSTRQPAIFHYYLTRLERCIPETSKAEILFELVRDAYMQVVVPHDESMTDKVREVTDVVNGMLFQAYVAKALRSISERTEGETGAFTSDERKALADQFLSDYESFSLDYYGLAEKYKETALYVDPSEYQE